MNLNRREALGALAAAAATAALAQDAEKGKGGQAASASSSVAAAPDSQKSQGPAAPMAASGPGVKGRYVRVEIPGKAVLNLAEVQVFSGDKNVAALDSVSLHQQFNRVFSFGAGGEARFDCLAHRYSSFVNEQASGWDAAQRLSEAVYASPARSELRNVDLVHSVARLAQRGRDNRIGGACEDSAPA